jgi:hypothetical protein
MVFLFIFQVSIFKGIQKAKIGVMREAHDRRVGIIEA